MSGQTLEGLGPGGDILVVGVRGGSEGGPLKSLVKIPTTSWGRGNGSGRKSRPLTMLKMVVLAPMPIARETTATATKPGVRSRVRQA